MDIQTTLDIINIISNQIEVLDDSENINNAEYYGAKKELTKLQSYLQSFIEGEIDKAELQTGE